MGVGFRGFSDLWDFFKFESFYFQEFFLGIIELSGQIIIVLFGTSHRKYEVLTHTLYTIHCISYIVYSIHNGPFIKTNNFISSLSYPILDIGYYPIPSYVVCCMMYDIHT
jgi:hypothetical protein